MLIHIHTTDCEFNVRLLVIVISVEAGCEVICDVISLRFTCSPLPYMGIDGVVLPVKISGERRKRKEQTKGGSFHRISCLISGAIGDRSSYQLLLCETFQYHVVVSNILWLIIQLEVDIV